MMAAKGVHFFAIDRAELVKPVQTLTRIYKGCCVFTEVLQIDSLELVHTIEGVIVVFKRMVTDFLQLTVALVDCLDKNPMQ
jgi:hypothetical protein